MDQNNMNQDQDMKKEMDDAMNKKPQRGGSGSGIFWTLFVIVILIIGGIWLWSSNATAPSAPEDTATTTDQQATTTQGPELGEDSSQDIQDQLEGINIDDLEGEFDNIDQDLQNLDGEPAQ